MAKTKITVRFRQDEIKEAIQKITRITRKTHTFNSENIRKDYKSCFLKMKARTMVASGELRESAFFNDRVTGFRSSYSMGYGATSNNQSVAQEFEGGNVHRSISQHYTKSGQAKCSRTPEDLYRKYGGYQFNASARRRAMAWSIEQVFGTTVRSAVKHGADLYYRPNFRHYASVLSTKTADYYKSMGIR